MTTGQGAEAFGDLTDKLKRIEEAKIRQLVSLLESTLERPDGVAAQWLLAEMRPRLAAIRPPRRHRAKRVFCQPFEDLLYSGPAGKTISGRIARGWIEPAWTLFIERAETAAIDRLRHGLSLREDRLTFWRLAAATLDGVYAEAAKSRTVAKQFSDGLGGPAAYEGIRLMARALSVADLVDTLDGQLPGRPIASFPEPALDALAEAIRMASGRSVEHVTVLVLVVMGRMARPWEMTEVMTRLTVSRDVTMPPEVADAVGRSLISETERQMQALRAKIAETPAHETPDAAGLSLSIGESVIQLDGVRASIGATPSSGPGRELERSRAGFRSLLDDHVVDGASGGILGGVTASAPPPPPRGRAKVGVSFEAPSWPQPPNQAVLQAAEDRAIGLLRARVYADSLGARSEIAASLRDAQDGIERGSEALIAHIRRGALDAAGRATVRAHLFSNVRLLELVAGPDRAGEILRDGLDALGE